MKLKNPKAKGSRVELKAKRQLEADGWIVEKVKYGGKFNKTVDFFGKWDLLALKDSKIMFVQCKCNRKPTMKPYQEFKKRYDWLNLIKMEVWVWYDRVGFDYIEVKG